ncbi:MAG TPA: lipoprotein-releasing ABC transporter permease subunit [Gammaproteobacteria bacterium]
MFRPVECFIGLRYVRSRRRRGAVSFMTGVSAVGIGLGVAALIVILSVMNGFEAELRTRLLSMTEHVSITAPGRGLPDWRRLAERVAERPGVAGVAPFVTLEGLLTAGSSLEPVVLRGVLPETEPAVSDIGRFLEAGTLESLAPGRVILGHFLALNLGVTVGDRVTLLVPRIANGRPDPEREALVVSGIFEAGVQDHDSHLALLHLEQASRLRGLDGAPQALGVRLTDPLAAPALRRELEASPEHGAGTSANPSSGQARELAYTDWTEQHRAYFQAVHIEKTMMTVILMFIVGVAAFNIVASLMMVVTDKQKDIAILRTYGLEPGRVARIFVVQGALIGLAGTVLGVALGLVLAFNVDVIVPWLESTFHFKIMPGDVYYVTEIPSEVQLHDVVLIPTVALAIAVLATLYPSRRAAAVAPAAALRYE